MLEGEITKIDVSTREKRRTQDFVAEEKPLYVFLNRSHYTTILCTPSNLKELAIGHVLSEGVVKSVARARILPINKYTLACYLCLKG